MLTTELRPLLISLLRCAITGEVSEKERIAALSAEELEGLYRLAASFDAAHLAAYALDAAGCFPRGAAAERFRRAQLAAISRTQRQTYTAQRIGETLEKAGIDHIFLKGTAVRPLYREPWMRTGADIDLLVRKEEHEKACRVLCRTLSCTRTRETAHDSTLSFSDGVAAEVHFSLADRHPAWERSLAGVWETAMPADGKKYEKRFSAEILYVYFFVHTAKHFENGGIGFRPLTDLYVMRRCVADNREKEKELLAAAGLERFAEVLERVADFWFSGGEADEAVRRTERYIFEGGIYGGMENRVAVKQTLQGGKRKYMLYRIFMPYEELIALYPRLRGRKWLLPWYWVKRWGYHLFKGSLSDAQREWDRTRAVQPGEYEQTKQYLEDMGLL